MSQIYSKFSSITVGTALAGILLYGFYRKFLNGDNFNHGTSNNNTKQLSRDMVAQMRKTQDTIFQLQQEIEKLREQIRYNHESIASLTSVNVKESVTIAVGTDDRNKVLFDQTTHVDKVNQDYARSTQVHFISKSKIEELSISSPITKTRSDNTMISSRTAPTPASDDDAWATPTSSETSSISGNEIDDLALHCIQSLQSLNSVNSLGPDYKYISPEIATYTPLPSKHLPMTTRNFITKLDKLSNTICPDIDKNVEKCWDLLMENKDELEIYLELTWRVCRAAVYLRTVYQLLKNNRKATNFVTAGLKYAKIGLKMVEDLPPYNNSILDTDSGCITSDDTNYEELKITAIAPMFKWAGSIIGISAEIAPGVQEKINAGFRARDCFKKTIELDPLDYFAYYNLARWHWEIFNLPSLLKRSANWISSEPFNSQISDVLPYVDQSFEKFPKDTDVFKVIPPDIYLIKGYCLKEMGDPTGARKNALQAKNALLELWNGLEITSVLDQETMKEIEKLMRNC